MKPEFDELEKFREAINVQAKLYCNVDDAYDREGAADFLQRLTKSWKMDKNRVIETLTQDVRRTVDKQLRYYVLRFADMMRIRYDKAKIIQRWDTLTDAEKNEMADGVIDYLNNHKKQD